MFVLMMTPLWLSQVLVYRQPIPHEELRQLDSVISINSFHSILESTFTFTIRMGFGLRISFKIE